MCWISNRGWGCLWDLSPKANDEIPIGNVVKILEWALLESVCRIDLIYNKAYNKVGNIFVLTFIIIFVSASLNIIKIRTACNVKHTFKNIIVNH